MYFDSVNDPLRVVAAVFERNGKYLACRRAPSKSAAGKWEFPGGKIEPGEDPRIALKREIKEELGLEIEVHEHVITSITRVGDLLIELACYRVTSDAQVSASSDHDQWLYILPELMQTLDWADPDLPAVKLLSQGT